MLDLFFFFFFKQKTAYEIGLGIPAEPLFRSQETLTFFLTHVFFCVSKNVSVSCAYTQGKREQFSGFNRRSEERRVGKECRYLFSSYDQKQKKLKILHAYIIYKSGFKLAFST